MERGNRKVRTGQVVSDRMDKTVVVSVERITQHPLYGRRIKRTKRYLAHNEGNVARLGDIVRIVETRPLSKRKRWRVAEVLQRHEGPVVSTEAVDAVDAVDAADVDKQPENTGAATEA